MACPTAACVFTWIGPVGQMANRLVLLQITSTSWHQTNWNGCVTVDRAALHSLISHISYHSLLSISHLHVVSSGPQATRELIL